MPVFTAASCVLAVGAASVYYASAQDTTPCGPYDIETGTATCDGVEINAYDYLCPKWNPTTCKVSQVLSDGRVSFSFQAIAKCFPYIIFTVCSNTLRHSAVTLQA